MTIHLASEIRDVFVGDSGPPLEFVFRYSDGVTLKDLTNFAAWVEFWYAGEESHVFRSALIPDPTHGIVRYIFQGDEYPTVGRIYIQPTILCPHYGAYLGVGWSTYYGCILQRRVIARAA